MLTVSCAFVRLEGGGVLGGLASGCALVVDAADGPETAEVDIFKRSSFNPGFPYRRLGKQRDRCLTALQMSPGSRRFRGMFVSDVVKA
jgi:hypothetical protein